MQGRRCGDALDVRRYLAAELRVGNKVGEGIAVILTAQMSHEMCIANHTLTLLPGPVVLLMILFPLFHRVVPASVLGVNHVSALERNCFNCTP